MKEERKDVNLRKMFIIFICCKPKLHLLVTIIFLIDQVINLSGVITSVLHAELQSALLHALFVMNALYFQIRIDNGLMKMSYTDDNACKAALYSLLRMIALPGIRNSDFFFKVQALVAKFIGLFINLNSTKGGKTTAKDGAGVQDVGGYGPDFILTFLIFFYFFYLSLPFYLTVKRLAYLGDGYHYWDDLQEEEYDQESTERARGDDEDSFGDGAVRVRTKEDDDEEQKEREEEARRKIENVEGYEI